MANEHSRNQSGNTARPRGPLSILIVEDEAAARIATRRFLQYRGFEVDAAGTADEAIEKARELHPDVLICDWKLDGQRDGIDVARLLQHEQDLDVIFVTAYALNELRQNAPDLRTIGCLRKPISLGTLAAAVESLADRKIH
ncbi:MAG TPA: response regulator [Woeseiaceae bacterium]|nr:response regulator [Woeseiaceae bacterium]